MILRRLLQALGERQSATPDELARLLGSSPDAVRDMLLTLQRRGLVQRLPQAGCGRHCHHCGPELERYARDGGGQGEALPCGPRRG